MAQHYSDPKRESDPYALPDLEVFFHNHEDAIFDCIAMQFCIPADDSDVPECMGTGWFYWYCFPGCLPDSDPMGPFASEDEALADAREGIEDYEDEDEDE